METTFYCEEKSMRRFGLYKLVGAVMVGAMITASAPVMNVSDSNVYADELSDAEEETEATSAKKEEAKNRKKARERQSELKQMKIGLKISDNDLNIKVRKMRGFLDDGDRVKIIIIFRGREMAHKEIGTDLLDKVLGLIGDDIVIEGKSQFNGRNLSVGIRKK